jgi:hypothetical protein
MGLLQRFDPPAYLQDFGPIPGQLTAWHNAVSKWFDGSIAMDQPSVPNGVFQFYNPSTFDPAGAVVEQAITWNAFPKELLRIYGRDRAMREADRLWPLEKYFSVLQGRALDQAKYPSLFKTLFRPQDEYCEWFVERDPKTNKIVRVTFTSEPPEYWHALFGGRIPGDDNDFPGDRDILLARYRELVSPEVKAEDLVGLEDISSPSGPFVDKGHYNPYNKWNTTHGIVHLGAPPNALTAEIQLGADGTVLRKDAHGRLLVEADALICCAAYGGPDRNSDPTIGAAINALARLGAYVTLRNPVGLYMDHIDLAGWQAPDRKSLKDCIRIVRGMPSMIERLAVEVPKDRDFTVGDILIGGIPIAYGGQIAECITVKLTGIANIPSARIANEPAPCAGRCCIDVSYPRSLNRPIAIKDTLPVGTREVYVGQGGREGSAGESAKHVMAPEIFHRSGLKQWSPSLKTPLHGTRRRTYLE